MDKLNHYRQLVEQVLTEHSQRQLFNGEIEVQLLLNQQQADYQVWYLGWNGDDRIHHGTAQRNIAAALLTAGSNFDDPSVVSVIMVTSLSMFVVIRLLARQSVAGIEQIS